MVKIKLTKEEEFELLAEIASSKKSPIETNSLPCCGRGCCKKFED